MYFKGVNPIKAILKYPEFSRYFFINSFFRVLYAWATNKKLRLRTYAGQKVHDAHFANCRLREAILLGEPFLATRYGSAELNIVTEVLLKRMQLKSKLNAETIKVSCIQSGVFPIEDWVLEKFTDLILEHSRNIDFLGTFRMVQEDFYIKHYCPKSVFLTHLYMYNFWFYDLPFTSALEGKKVLVIHPFEDSIQNQYKKRELLFTNEKVLPRFELKTLKAVQSIAGESNKFQNWFDALEHMYNEAMKIDFDIAIVGCGAYGLPLSSMIKQSGKVVLHMGGVTQILFGIKGKRWDSDQLASKMYNEHWIRPDQSEIPGDYTAVEGGCYW